MKLLLGFGFLFRSWGISVYAIMCLRKAILGMFNSIMAVVRTEEAAREGKQNCVLCSMAACGCGHVAFSAILKVSFPTGELPKDVTNPCAKLFRSHPLGEDPVEISSMQWCPALEDTCVDLWAEHTSKEGRELIGVYLPNTLCARCSVQEVFIGHPKK